MSAPCAAGSWPGGQYLAVNYLVIDDEAVPPFPTTRDELCKRFAPRFELVADWVPRSYPNRTGRERMFWGGARLRIEMLVENPAFAA